MRTKDLFWQRLISVMLSIAVLIQMASIGVLGLEGNAAGFSGNGTESSPYLIASADDWDALSNHINNGGTEYTGKHFKLTKNISVSTVLGNRPNNSSDSNDNVFCGVFDGDGHTLNVNINNSGFAAPFAVAHNTTIKNLTVTGTVSSSSNHASGLVAASKPKNAYESTYLNIQNVTVSADIRCNSHIAGIVGHAHKADITMENVVFDGSLNASSVQGGFIGWGGIPNAEYNATFKDCMFAGTYKSDAAFHPVGFADGQGTATLVNDFYTTSTGSGGSPVPTTGSGQVKLFAVTVEKDGAVNYYTSISDAISGWKNGGKLTLFKDASYSSVINIRPMYGYNAGEYTLDLNGKIFNIQSVQVGLNNSPNTLRTGPHLIIEDNKTGGILCFSESGMIDYGGLIELRGGTLTGGNGTWGGLFLLHIYASLDMYDGVTLTGNTSTYGGAVLVGSDSQFNMYGGKISGNSASDSGGGVVVFDNDAARFNMYGGEISGNRAPKGGGVSVNVGSFHICGNNAIIKDNVNGGSFSSETATYNGGTPNNVYLPSGKKINIDSELSSTPVGITLQNGEGVFTNGWNTYMSGKNPDDYFASDNANYGVILNGGEVEISVPPVASVISGDTTTSYSAISDALNAWTTGSTLKLLKDITTSSTINVPSGAHTLNLNGHTIKAGSSGYSVITVGSGSNTIIDDTSDKVGVITGGSVGQNYGGGVTVDGGTLTLKNGVIKGNTNTYNGIGNCGGGIHVRNGGTFIMEGGEISDNSSYVGGGVCADSSATTVSIIGGVIKNNKTDRFGSAVWAGRNSSAVFRIGGDAEIIDNISTWTADKDGEATINFTSALLVSGDPTVHGNWKTSGNSTPNTHINLDNVGNAIQVIELEGALTNDSGTPKITITPLYRWNDLSNGKNFVFTKNWSKYMGNADPADYFVCGNPAYKIFLNSSGEAEVGTPPAASVISGETATNYGSLSDAVNAWTTGSTLKLLKDITTSSTINVPSGAHTLDLNGHGIKMTGSGSVITVNNGATLNLEDSTPTTEHRFTVADAKSNGAGLATVNDTLTGGYKTFTGGYITGGNATNGGGIKVNGTAQLILNGGTVIGNRSSFMGAGIKADNSGEGTNVRVTVNGGAIIYNTVNGYGAGICSDAGVTVNGGTVAYNYASNNPGGIHCHYLYITGGRIENNFSGASDFAAGAHADHEVFMSGSPVITNNLFNGVASNLDWDRPEHNHNHMINITGALTEDAKISVTLRNNISGTFTNGWNTYMSGKDPADYFVSDVADYEVRLENGEAVAEYPYVTGVTASGYTGDYDGKAHSISVSVPEGASVKYGTADGTYNLSEAPAYTSAGTYTIYYRVSQNKRTDLTGSATVKINKINATVTITGHNSTVDYDGKAHSADGYDAVASTDLYDVTKDFTYSGRAEAVRTNAGATAMGLKAEKFTNTNDNFETVTFNVTDGYLTINKINVTVTITGHTNTVDYDGNAHSADGYDAVASSDLYDVTKDFTYSGRTEAVRTNAGTTAMGLKAELFENKNSNFSSVTFIVTDGYLTINTVDAVVTTAPVSARPIYNGSNLDLIVSGKADGGTLYYAIGDDPRKAPADDSFNTAIPQAKELGSYYVWYKVIADSNHNDLEPVSVKVVLAEESWLKLSGVLYENDGKTPLGDSVVTLTKGNQQIDYVITDSNGNYEFIVPAGTYNIVANGHGVSATGMVKIFDNTSQDFIMSGGKTESIIKVNGDSNFGITAGGLNEEAYSIRKSGNIDSDTNVSVLMTVESKADNTATNTAAFSTLMRRKSFMFFDVKLEATVGSDITVLKTTNNVLEIAVPYTKVNRRGLSVYYSDGSGVKSFKESDSKENGTYSVDKKNGFIYIYSNQFSTFAIGYTPYYHVKSTVSLGSFKGNATVILDGQNGEGNFELKDIDLSKISFADIPKGEYKMSVTWKDGATNTLTMPITVS